MFNRDGIACPLLKSIQGTCISANPDNDFTIWIHRGRTAGFALRSENPSFYFFYQDLIPMGLSAQLKRLRREPNKY